MKMMRSLKKLALAGLLVSVGMANAAVYEFNIAGDYTATFQLDSAIPPDNFTLGETFSYANVAGFPDAVLGTAAVTFFNAALNGGIRIDDLNAGPTLFIADGPQLYTGSESSPVFTTGTFALTQFEGTDNYSLTISEVSAPPVPEPATGALLVSGLALLAIARKRLAG